VKFSIAGTRPKAWIAKKASTAPTPVGSMMPTLSLGLAILRMALPSAKEARTISS
jgi:hypothetical protein